ncbi:putative homeobox and C2H2 transcription [Rosellinia necatrix]|uniref:Putative homeobox and C2H2 transcription n=1 Tax=Rosellinia necatrix TaxID=77044 RepID=A0A1W2TF45_ROSNE|nr:putative homeobox and C2H2 transcription [Rosellinia necatrix]
MDDPSRILAQARQQLEALKQAGLSRDDLLALLEEETQQQHQPMAPVTPVTPVTPDASALHNYSYHDMNAAFKPPPQYRSSVSTVSSSSSRDSCFSAASVRSSVSSTTNPASESKFWCTSCNKTFKRKFDWKRHEEEFHDRSRKYPCDSCNQSFWGPNTFNQHHKSAHGCQTCPHAEMVMRPMRKRRAYGCGFCAALHGQFERHIDHVATHFESGMTKNDWSHSNVIYGLLHQHGIIEAWKALVASKHNRFNDRQPMFGWPPESTGRAHGFVENENPGQLQDLLEFFDGTKDSAKKIVQLAETCVHVVLRPKTPPASPAAGSDSIPPSSGTGNSSHRQSVSRATVREPRRSASTSAIMKGSKSVRRTASSSNAFETQPPKVGLASVPSMTLPSTPAQPHQQLGSTGNVYPSYIPSPNTATHTQPSLTPISTHTSIYTDKALPPPPLDPVSPMAVDFPSFPEAHHMAPDPQTQSFLPEVDFVSDWHSFTSTLVGGVGDEQQQQQQQHQHQHPHQHPHQQQHQQQQTMTPFGTQGFPMTWGDLGHFPGAPGT